MKRKGMKKYVVAVYRRQSAFSDNGLSNEWHRVHDLVIWARTRESAWNKLDKIGRKMVNDYCRIDATTFMQVDDTTKAE